MSNQGALQEGARQYRAGMRAAKYDYMRGAGTVKSNLLYGLQGRSAAFCKGYRDYYRRYMGM